MGVYPKCGYDLRMRQVPVTHAPGTFEYMVNNEIGTRRLVNTIRTNTQQLSFNNIDFIYLYMMLFPKP